MRWPWKRRETRASTYEDALIDLLVGQAEGGQGPSATATAALEAASGIVARAFAAAETSGPVEYIEALTPDCLGMIGRALIRRGDVLFLIEVSRGELGLIPASEWDVEGGYHPATWSYRLTLAGPTRQLVMRNVPAERVLHFRYAADPARPWYGVGPIQSAALSGKLSARTLNALADESGSMVGYVAPMPKDGQDSTVTQLRRDLRNSKGKTHLVESMSTGWAADDTRTRPARDWMRQRWGPEPPAAMIELQREATREVLAACGLSPALFDAKAAAASREAYRQALHGTIAPLGRKVQAELAGKLDADIGLSFDSLFAADIMGRARAFNSLVGGGMSPAHAAGIVGIEATEADVTPGEPE